MRAQIFMTLLKNAKNGQNAYHSIESTLLSQSPTVKATRHTYVKGNKNSILLIL